jgi:hypothetical protein
LALEKREKKRKKQYFMYELEHDLVFLRKRILFLRTKIRGFFF